MNNRLGRLRQKLIGDTTRQSQHRVTRNRGDRQLARLIQQTNRITQRPVRQQRDHFKRVIVNRKINTIRDISHPFHNLIVRDTAELKMLTP